MSYLSMTQQTTRCSCRYKLSSESYKWSFCGALHKQLSNLGELKFDYSQVNQAVKDFTVVFDFVLKTQAWPTHLSSICMRKMTKKVSRSSRQSSKKQAKFTAKTRNA